MTNTTLHRFYKTVLQALGKFSSYNDDDHAVFSIFQISNHLITGRCVRSLLFDHILWYSIKKLSHSNEKNDAIE